MDVDGTISHCSNGDYANAEPAEAVIRKMREYQDKGFEIVLYTARNMRTYEGSLGKITANTVPVLIEWLARHNVPYDEIIVGKPWCGTEGFYVDDKAIRPSEFTDLSYQEIAELTGK